MQLRQAHTEYQVDDASIHEEVLSWVRRVIIGINLCPFAEKPLRQDRIRVQVVRGDNNETILSSVLDELIARTTTPGTTLVVCPEYYPDDFESFLDLNELIEEGLIKDDDTFDGVLQVVPFHPLFQFEGSQPSSIDNWTNRSPYPLFHILREDEVSRAVDQLQGDSGKVWRRNLEVMQQLSIELGADTLQNFIQGKEIDETKLARLQEILKQ
jgi:hypothetical protein